jgi:hypothetical protein
LEEKLVEISKTFTHVTGMRGFNRWFLGALVTLFLAGTPALATTINSTCHPTAISGCAAAENQLDVEATSPVSGQLQIVISNLGPAIVTEVYFDFSNALFSSVAQTAFTGSFVNFSTANVHPGDLPGGNGFDPDFVAVASTNIGATNPQPKWGVGLNESLTLVLNISADKTLDDVVNQFISGDFRIGLHVTGIANDDPRETSAAMVSNNLPPGTPRDLEDPGVPEPSTWLLMSAGVVGLIARRRFIG